MAKNKRGFISPYRTYMFVDGKDPVIDFTRTLVEDSEETLTSIHESSGVSKSTLYNWFHGSTRRPQFTTIAPVLLALGQSTIDLRALARRGKQ